MVKEFNFKILSHDEFEALAKPEQEKYLDDQNEFITALINSMKGAKPDLSYHYTKREWFPLARVVWETS